MMSDSEHEVRCAEMCGTLLHWYDRQPAASPGIMLQNGWLLINGAWRCPICASKYDQIVAPSR